MIKVFRTTVNNYKQHDRFSKHTNHADVERLAVQEARNLKRLRKAGVYCPEVVAQKNNIVLMSLIGVPGEPARKLKHHMGYICYMHQQVCNLILKMYVHAKLVHGDLSEHNILVRYSDCYVIDVAQAVDKTHPKALELLQRDIDTMMAFFKRTGMKKVHDPKKLFQIITGPNPKLDNYSLYWYSY